MDMASQADSDETRQSKARQRIEAALGTTETAFLPRFGTQPWAINALEYFATLATACQNDGKDHDFLRQFISDQWNDQKPRKLSGQFMKVAWEQYQESTGQSTASNKRRASEMGVTMSTATKQVRRSVGHAPASPATRSTSRRRSSVSSSYHKACAPTALAMAYQL